MTGNYILNVAILAFLTAQISKIIIELWIHRKIDFRRVIGSGGMPSSHSATVVALATSVAKVCGMRSPEFAISVILAGVVMYDASNIRRAAGEQAKRINYIMDIVGKMPNATHEQFEKQLKELLGHTPLQVLIGALLGLAFGLIM